eukprot:4646725-Prorocentrum_lima.AAC.1
MHALGEINRPTLQSFHNVDVSPNLYYTCTDTQSGGLIALDFKANNVDGSVINGGYVLLHYGDLIYLVDNGIDYVD